MKKWVKFVLMLVIAVSSLAFNNYDVAALTEAEDEGELIAEPTELLQNLSDEFMDNNRSFESGNLYTTMLFSSSGQESSVLMDVDLMYDNNQMLNDIVAIFEAGSAEGYSSEAIAYSKNFDPNTVFYRMPETEEWTEEFFPDSDEFTVNPDYFGLAAGVEMVIDGALNNEFEFDFVETDTEYLLYSFDENLSVSDAFGVEYSLEFEGITEADLEKEVIIAIDKESYFINNIYFNLTGIVNVEIQTTVDFHNEYLADEFISFVEELQ